MRFYLKLRDKRGCVNKLHILQARVSVSKLQLPAPDAHELVEVFKAASRAADHGMLRPWRFLTIEGDGLEALSRIFVTAASHTNDNVSSAVIDKCKNMPFRAPMIIVAIVKYQAHIKIPSQEQALACGAAVQNMLNALFALGYGAIWRSGEMAQHAYVKKELGLSVGEEIIGFVYVGTPVKPFANPPEADVHLMFKAWPTK